MKYVVWLVGHALALLVAIWLFSGISLRADTLTDRVLQLLVTGAIFGVITSFVRPVIRFLSIPFIVFTLGLFLLVINALMLMLTSKLAGAVGLGFHVSGFWTALFGAIVIALAGMVIDAVLPGDAL